MPSTGNIPCVKEVLAGNNVWKLEPDTVGAFVEDISEIPLEARKSSPLLLKDERVSKIGINLSLSRGCWYTACCWQQLPALC